MALERSPSCAAAELDERFGIEARDLRRDAHELAQIQ